MKKILAMMLTAAMMLSMSAAVMAAEGEPETPTEIPNQEATFTKIYKSTNGEANPEEKFTFTYVAKELTNSNEGKDVDDMPEIPDSTITFAEGTATKEGFSQTVNVALAGINWPSVGVYYYEVKETAGTTLGVEYDKTVANLKVTVAYDQGTDTYYTAFVSLNLVDADGDGKTDGNKTYGFTNIYNAGDLTVEKNVTGNLGDVDKDFEVTVTFKNETGKEVNSTITYESNATVEADKESGNVVFVDGATVATVPLKLKNGEKVSFNNIPYGVTYTVEEADYTSEAAGGYEAAKYSLNNAEATTTSIDTAIDSELDVVVITNNKSTNVDTGISVDSIPYIAMLGVVAIGGAGVVVSKKRRSED